MSRNAPFAILCVFRLAFLPLPVLYTHYCTAHTVSCTVSVLNSLSSRIALAAFTLQLDRALIQYRHRTAYGTFYLRRTLLICPINLAAPRGALAERAGLPSAVGVVVNLAQGSRFDIWIECESLWQATPVAQPCSACCRIMLQDDGVKLCG